LIDQFETAVVITVRVRAKSIICCHSLRALYLGQFANDVVHGHLGVEFNPIFALVSQNGISTAKAV